MPASGDADQTFDTVAPVEPSTPASPEAAGTVSETDAGDALYSESPAPEADVPAVASETEAFSDCAPIASETEPFETLAA